MTLFSFGVSLSSTSCVGLLRMLQFPPTGRSRSSKSWETEAPDCLQVWVRVIFFFFLFTLGESLCCWDILQPSWEPWQGKKRHESQLGRVSEWTHTCLTECQMSSLPFRYRAIDQTCVPACICLAEVSLSKVLDLPDWLRGKKSSSSTQRYVSHHNRG